MLLKRHKRPGLENGQWGSEPDLKDWGRRQGMSQAKRTMLDEGLIPGRAESRNNGRSGEPGTYPWNRDPWSRDYWTISKEWEMKPPC